MTCTRAGKSYPRAHGTDMLGSARNNLATSDGLDSNGHVEISIASLIYKSTRFADAVYESINEHTPQLRSQGAEFYFVANDATRNVIDHLKRKCYKHYVNVNPVLTPDRLRKNGFAPPEYIRRVYRGYNFGIRKARGEIVVLVNSDNFFSPNWLESLLKHLTRDRIVCSQLVERKHPKYAIFPGAYHAEFGNHPDNFRKSDFVDYCQKTAIEGIRDGGAYMPCAFHKDLAMRVGLYPEGNVLVRNAWHFSLYRSAQFPGEGYWSRKLKRLKIIMWRNLRSYFNRTTSIMTGDAYFFDKLARLGVKHVTALDSLVYHLKEGEMDE